MPLTTNGGGMKAHHENPIATRNGLKLRFPPPNLGAPYRMNFENTRRIVQDITSRSQASPGSTIVFRPAEVSFK